MEHLQPMNIIMVRVVVTSLEAAVEVPTQVECPAAVTTIATAILDEVVQAAMVQLAWGAGVVGMAAVGPRVQEGVEDPPSRATSMSLPTVAAARTGTVLLG